MLDARKIILFLIFHSTHQCADRNVKESLPRNGPTPTISPTPRGHYPLTRRNRHSGLPPRTQIVCKHISRVDDRSSQQMYRKVLCCENVRSQNKVQAYIVTTTVGKMEPLYSSQWLLRHKHGGNYKYSCFIIFGPVTQR